MLPAADSAGQPFRGREFQDNPFASDTGEADPVLLSALGHFHALVAAVPEERPARAVAAAWVAVIDALRKARLLSPLVAKAGDWGLTDQGLVVEKTQELSVVHLQGPDGRGVAPVFSDVSSMVQWRSEARPIPVTAAAAALAAASDGLALMVLNPGSEEAVTLKRGVIEALASDAPYTPAWVDPDVADAIAEGIASIERVIPRYKILPGDISQTLGGPEIVIALGLEPGLSQGELDQLVAQLSAVWAHHEVLNRRVDGLGVKILPV